MIRIWTILLLIVALVFIVFCTQNYYKTVLREPATYLGDQWPDNNTRKLIVYWNFVKDFGNMIWNQSVMSNCKSPWLNTCDVITMDQHRFAPSPASAADAVVFHWRGMSWNKFPRKRLPHQRYVFMLYESPPHTFNEEKLRSPYFNDDYFNWTMTYRSDSDVMQYAMQQLGGQQHKWSQLPNLHVTNSNMSELRSLVRKRNLTVAWFVSNCHTPSKREVYAKELQKYIQVDIFGKCGSSNCTHADAYDEPARCDQLLKRQYFFYLAFENSICRDYVTEKFYRAWYSQVVPVVLHGDTYKQLGIPENSYIAADSFDSPAALAKYLQYLISNQTAYLAYFNWYNDYMTKSNTNMIPNNYDFCTHTCILCTMLHDRVLAVKHQASLYKWWIRDAHCLPNYGRRIIDNRKTIIGKLFGWIH